MYHKCHVGVHPLSPSTMHPCIHSSMYIPYLCYSPLFARIYVPYLCYSVHCTHPVYTRISPVYTYVHSLPMLLSECIVVVPVLQHCRCGMLCSCTHGITGYSPMCGIGGTRVHTLFSTVVLCHLRMHTPCLPSGHVTHLSSYLYSSPWLHLPASTTTHRTVHTLL